MGDTSVIFFLYKEKIMFKNHKLKSNQTTESKGKTKQIPMDQKFFNLITVPLV
jgi:hypothetical protein